MPGKSQGQWSLVSYSPWGRKESDMPEHTQMHLQTPDSEPRGWDSGHPTMQASPQTSRNARKRERCLEEVMEERDDGYRLLPWDPRQQQGLVNLTNTPFSRVAKAVMGHGDLGDEMNLSLIHSIACAKYSIIKVTHTLYDPTFPDISSFERSHTPSVIFFFFKSGFSFCSSTGICLLLSGPLPEGSW